MKYHLNHIFSVLQKILKDTIIEINNKKQFLNLKEIENIDKTIFQSLTVNLLREKGNFSTNILFKLRNLLDKERINYFLKLLEKKCNSKFEITLINNFINFLVKKEFYQEWLLKKGNSFANFLNYENSFVIESISANPNGELHLGHARQAVISQIYKNVLNELSYDFKDYYLVSTLGNQMIQIIFSILIKIPKITDPIIEQNQEIFKEYFNSPSNYKYNVDNKLLEKFTKFISNNKFSDFFHFIFKAREFCTIYFLKQQFKLISKVINQEFNPTLIFDINFFLEKENHFRFQKTFTETSLFLNFNKELLLFEEKDNVNSLVFLEDNNSISFKSSIFGDFKNRIIYKNDPIKNLKLKKYQNIEFNHEQLLKVTYSFADLNLQIAKFNFFNDQQNHEVVTFLGADHHGYVSFLKSIEKFYKTSKHQILKPFSINENTNFSYPLIQLVSLKDKNERIKMSKRLGKTINLSEILLFFEKEKIDKGVFTSFISSHSINKNIEFDIEYLDNLLTSKNNKQAWVQIKNLKNYFAQKLENREKFENDERSLEVVIFVNNYFYKILQNVVEKKDPYLLYDLIYKMHLAIVELDIKFNDHEFLSLKLIWDKLKSILII